MVVQRKSGHSEAMGQSVEARWKRNHHHGVDAFAERALGRRGQVEAAAAYGVRCASHERALLGKQGLRGQRRGSRWVARESWLGGRAQEREKERETRRLWTRKGEKERAPTKANQMLGRGRLYVCYPRAGCRCHGGDMHVRRVQGWWVGRCLQKHFHSSCTYTPSFGILTCLSMVASHAMAWPAPAVSVAPRPRPAAMRLRPRPMARRDWSSIGTVDNTSNHSPVPPPPPTCSLPFHRAHHPCQSCCCCQPPRLTSLRLTRKVPCKTIYISYAPSTPSLDAA